MKTRNLLVAFALTSFAVSFTACKKNDSSTPENETENTTQLSKDQAVTDNLVEDANDVFMEAANEKGLMGAKPANTHERPMDITDILGCANVTATPLIGFPKTLVIEFTQGCTSPNGIVRSGKITIVLSDSVRKSGSTAVMTFENYFVNNFKKEGTITWTNTSTGAVKSWQRKVENGKITAPGGRYWLHNGTKDIIQTAGSATPINLFDDEFTITGTHTVTNMAGFSRTSTIVEPLHKKKICDNIDKGTVKVQGPNHFAIIDFGDGTCDNIATFAFDGGNPIPFLLR